MNEADARRLARQLLADDVPDRWCHVQGVAAAARKIAPLIEGGETLVMAAYLHDIGYSPGISLSRFHPLDGARYLRDNGWPPTVVNLVANHSNARLQAHYRGLLDELEGEFPIDPELPHRFLQFCDLSVDLDGQPVSIDERIAGIRSRHQGNAAMLSYLNDTEPQLRRLVVEVAAEMATIDLTDGDSGITTTDGSEVGAEPEFASVPQGSR